MTPGLRFRHSCRGPRSALVGGLLSALVFCGFSFPLAYAWAQGQAPETKPSQPDVLFPVPKDGLWGFIDKTGQYDRAKRAMVGKYRVIDTKGSFINDKTYASAYSFSEGLAAVQVGGKWGYLDLVGKQAIAPKFDSPGAFSEGLAAVVQAGKAVYIDKTGKVVLRPEITFGGPFRFGS